MSSHSPFAMRHSLTQSIRISSTGPNVGSLHSFLTSQRLAQAAFSHREKHHPSRTPSPSSTVPIPLSSFYSITPCIARARAIVSTHVFIASRDSEGTARDQPRTSRAVHPSCGSRHLYRSGRRGRDTHLQAYRRPSLPGEKHEDAPGDLKIHKRRAMW